MFKSQEKCDTVYNTNTYQLLGLETSSILYLVNQLAKANSWDDNVYSISILEINMSQTSFSLYLHN